MIASCIVQHVCADRQTGVSASEVTPLSQRTCTDRCSTGRDRTGLCAAVVSDQVLQSGIQSGPDADFPHCHNACPLGNECIRLRKRAHFETSYSLTSHGAQSPRTSCVLALLSPQTVAGERKGPATRVIRRSQLASSVDARTCLESRLNLPSKHMRGCVHFKLQLLPVISYRSSSQAAHQHLTMYRVHTSHRDDACRKASPTL
jgi:hypothetical protein